MAGTTRLSHLVNLKIKTFNQIFYVDVGCRLIDFAFGSIIRFASRPRSLVLAFMSMYKKVQNGLSQNGGNDEARTRDLLRDRQAL